MNETEPETKTKRSQNKIKPNKRKTIQHKPYMLLYILEQNFTVLFSPFIIYMFIKLKLNK